MIHCDVPGCRKACKTAQGLAGHKQWAHGILAPGDHQLDRITLGQQIRALEKQLDQLRLDYQQLEDDGNNSPFDRLVERFQKRNEREENSTLVYFPGLQKYLTGSDLVESTCQVCGKQIYVAYNGLWYHYGSSSERPEPHEAKPKQSLSGRPKG